MEFHGAMAAVLDSRDYYRLFELERSRLRMGARYLWRRLTTRGAAGLGRSDADVLAGAVASAYGEVLDDAELCAFLDLEPGQRPALSAQSDL